MSRILVLASLIFAASLFVVALVNAQEIYPDFPTADDVNAIAKQLYCPVCPNTPLDVCETQACKDWRNQIRDQLSAGWTEQEIKDYFVNQYGERVLAEPERSGFTSLVWLLPVITVSLGIIILWQVIKGWRNRQFPESDLQPIEEQFAREILEQIERELQEID
ncbi:MAG: hypothetical protein GTN46_04955 [Gammaproteobacteria bacterium]|nr:hypothetical protein [Gammaproteobacteria bacterium]